MVLPETLREFRVLSKIKSLKISGTKETGQVSLWMVKQSESTNWTFI